MHIVHWPGRRFDLNRFNISEVTDLYQIIYGVSKTYDDNFSCHMQRLPLSNSRQVYLALRPRHEPVAVRRFEVVGTLERATNALLWANDTEVDLGGRHKSKILWLSHRLVVAPEVAGHRPQALRHL